MVMEGPLIGREGELAYLEQMVAISSPLTLTGPGGCGKSRVARELAGRVMSRTPKLQYRLVELAATRSEEQVVDAILRSLGGRERSGRTALEALGDIVAQGPWLVVLDNCEHVRAEVGSLLETILERAAGTCLVLTSREPLGITGETVFQLGPLSVPGTGHEVAAVVRSDAGRMFVDRAVSIDPAFALTPSIARAVVRICRELDGLPLALGLAAAGSAATTTTEIAAGLSQLGRPAPTSSDVTMPQHRSLAASLDWSYRLLDEREQCLFRRLSCFAGGWTTAAARAVALPDVGEAAVDALLDALEAKGLIVSVSAPGDRRWTFLRTVGEYAAVQLTDEEKNASERRHLLRFRTYAAEADRRLGEPDSHTLIDVETANLRLALERALVVDVDTAFDLVASLTRHWILAEHFDEARTACAAVLAHAEIMKRGPPARTALGALVLCGSGVIAMLNADYQTAVENTMDGLVLLEGVEDADIRARCLQLSGMVLILTGLDLEAGLGSTRRAVELLRGGGDALGLAWALANLAYAAGLCDRFADARSAYDEFLTVPGAADHVRLRTWAEQAMAWTDVMVGSPRDALRHADLALKLEGDWPSMTHFQGLTHRIHALVRGGRTADALDEGHRAMSRAAESGAVHAMAGIELGLVMALYMDGDLDTAAARAQGLVEMMPQVHTAALMREVLGHVALARGDVPEATAQGRELAALATVTGSGRLHAVSGFLWGCAARQEGDTHRARHFLQSALAAYSELGLERGGAEVLDELALMAADKGDLRRTARLVGAASAAWRRLNCARPASDIGRLEAVRVQFVTGDEGLGGDEDHDAEWAGAWSEGEALSLAEAMAYARRAGGRRRRPADGRASLTPAEIDVAELAAAGASNPDIASRLFMSRSTVKMHLSNVYRKLQITNRTQLARSAAMSADNRAPAAHPAPEAAE
jgi:predicted ATPase/DNA-binding CsgD family transcriptional regulator